MRQPPLTAVCAVSRPVSLKAGQRLLVVAAALSLLLGAACSSGSSAAGSNAAVTLSVFQFEPRALEVKAGTRVTWTNRDEILHTVTSVTSPGTGALFDGRLDGKGATFSFRFDQAGAYTYACSIHESMKGEITVK